MTSDTNRARSRIAAVLLTRTTRSAAVGQLLTFARPDGSESLRAPVPTEVARSILRQSGGGAHKDRALVASNCTDPDVLSAAARDTSRTVRQALAANPHTPDHVIERLHTWAQRNGHHDVLAHTIFQRSPHDAVETLDSSAALRWASAQRASDDGEAFLAAWSSHPDARPELIAAADAADLQDPDYTDLLGVLDRREQAELLEASEQLHTANMGDEVCRPWRPDTVPMTPRKARLLVDLLPAPPRWWPSDPRVGGPGSRLCTTSRYPHVVADILMSSGVPGFQLTALNVHPVDGTGEDGEDGPFPSDEVLDRAIDDGHPALVDEALSDPHRLHHARWERIARQLDRNADETFISHSRRIRAALRYVPADLDTESVMQLARSRGIATIPPLLQGRPEGLLTSDQWGRVIDAVEEQSGLDRLGITYSILQDLPYGAALPPELLRHLTPSHRRVWLQLGSDTLAQVLDEELGESETLWREVLTLLPEWTGSLQQLIDTAYACAPDPATDTDVGDTQHN